MLHTVTDVTVDADWPEIPIATIHVSTGRTMKFDFRLGPDCEVFATVCRMLGLDECAVEDTDELIGRAFRQKRKSAA